MSGDDTARALGANGAVTVTIAGKECTVRPMSARELAEVERICVEEYKDGFLATIARNLSKLPDKKRRGTLIEEQLVRVAGWTVHDLPTVKSHDAERINLTPKLRTWLTETYKMDKTVDLAKLRATAASALDQGMLPPEHYTLVTDSEPPFFHVGYVNWWITGCLDGMIAFAWVCFRPDGVTRDEVASEMGKNRLMLTELTREIEKLSRPAVGNG